MHPEFQQNLGGFTCSICVERRLRSSISLPTPFYVTFIIAVATVAAVMLAALRMIFAIYTVKMTSADLSRCKRILILYTGPKLLRG
jgi:hypothetical protein